MKIRKKGIEYLINENLVENSPQSIATFLHQTPELSKTVIGEYIGQGTNKEILAAYCSQLDVSGMKYDEALRSFLIRFRLPGEAQIIDRIVESFAVRYCQQNPGIFPNSDLAYTLVFAMIMLNTSIHNPKVDRKMSLEDFISNFRNADEAGAIPEKTLEAMYRSIKEEKLDMGTDDQDQSGKIAITARNLPNKICQGEKSQIATVSIPVQDASLRLKLQGQGVECEPNILTFAESAKQTFIIKGIQLGQQTLAFAKMGKSSRMYSKIPAFNIMVVLPAFEHTFQLCIKRTISNSGNNSGNTGGNSNTLTSSNSNPNLLENGEGEILELGVVSRELKNKWVSLFQSVISQLKDRSRLRSESNPAPSMIID